MCVGFLYTLVVRQPSGSLKTAVSRKASLLSFCLHGEADGRLMVVEMQQEVVYVFAIQDGKGIVHVAFPDPRLIG